MIMLSNIGIEVSELVLNLAKVLFILFLTFIAAKIVRMFSNKYFDKVDDDEPESGNWFKRFPNMSFVTWGSGSRRKG